MQSHSVNSSQFLSSLVNEKCVDDRLLELGGRVALEEKQWVLGEEIFSCLLERRYKPEDLVGLAHCLVKQNRLNEGEECLLEALKFIPEPCPLLFCIYKNLGDVSLEKNNLPLAEEHYNKAHTIQPDSLSLRFHKGFLHLKQKDYKKAAGYFIRILKHHIDHEKSWLGLALSRKALGDEELAEASLLRCLDFNPSNTTALQLKKKWKESLLLKPSSISFHFSP